MEIQRTKNSILSIFWGIINKFIGIFGPFITRTAIIYVLGDQYSGLNSVFFAILNVLNLAELGFGNAVVFSMYKPIAENDTDKINALLSLYRKIYKILGLIILVIGLLLLPFLKYLISGSYPEDVSLHLVYIVYLANTVVSYLLFAYKNSILNAFQRFDVVSNIASVVNLGLYCAQVFVIIYFKNYYYYIILMPLATVLNNVITAIVVKRIFPKYVPEGELPDSERKRIFGNVKALIGHKIGGTVVTSADNLVISAYLGLTLVAYYNNYHYLSSAVVSLISVISNSILGGLGNRLVIRSKEDNLKLFYNLTFGICWVVGWCSICLMCLSQPFMTIWMGKERLLSNLTVFWIALYFYSWQFRIIGLSFKDAAGMWRADFWKPYLGAVINIVVNIILVNLIGLNGVLIATIIDLAGVYFPWETHVLFRDLFCCSSKEYYKKHFLYFITMFALGALTYLICSFVIVQGVMGLIIKALICFALPNIIMCLMFYKTDEFRFYKNICVRVLKRIKTS